MKKILFLAAVICLMISGCKHNVDTTPDQPYEGNPLVAAYFCVPEQLASCLPLIIYRTPEGWRAHYGGSADESSIELRPVRRCYNNGEEDDAFDEYVDGKLSGHYFFGDYWLSCCYGNTLCYLKEGSEDTVFFYCELLYDTAVLNRKDIDCDDDLYFEKSQFDCQRALMQAWQNPRQTLKNGVSFCDAFEGTESAVSPDGKIRLSLSPYHTLGNGHGNSWQYVILQYDDGKGVSTLCNFLYPYFENLLDGTNLYFDFGHLNDFHIHLVSLNGKDYYLIESTPWDEAVHPIVNDGNYNCPPMDNCWSAIAAYQIRNGKLCPANIINGQNKVLVVADQTTTDMHIKVDPARGTISVPRVSTPDYVFSGTYDVIQLK